MELKLPDWKTIPVQDRFDVISQIWDSLLDEPEMIPVPTWQLEEFENRMARYVEDPRSKDWQRVFTRMRARHEVAKSAH